MYKRQITGSSSIALGQNVTVNASAATAMGYYSTVATGHNGAFVFGDNTSTTTVTSTAPNQFTGMFANGYRLLTNRADLSKGMTIDVLGNVVLSGSITAPSFIPSDIRLKKDIQTLTGCLLYTSDAADDQINV